MSHLYEAASAYCVPIFVIAADTPQEDIEAAIDRVLAQRALLPAALLAEISNYTVVEQDLIHYDELAQLANLTPGPIVCKIASKNNSYGLIAEHDYDATARQLVAGYGGLVVADVKQQDSQENHYMVAYKPGKLIDGRIGFTLQQKGRWVNEPNLDPEQIERLQQLVKDNQRNAIIDTLQRMANVDMTRASPLRNKMGALAEFVSYKPGGGNRTIYKGQEFVWYYGRHYQRPWLEPQRLQCSICDSAKATHQCRKCHGKHWRCCASEFCRAQIVNHACAATDAIGLALDNEERWLKEIEAERTKRAACQQLLVIEQGKWRPKDGRENYPQLLSTIIGPNGITKFTYARQTFYLFGEEHHEKGKGRQAVARSSVGYMDVQLSVADTYNNQRVDTTFPTVATGKMIITTQNWSIERFLHVLVSDRLTDNSRREYHPLFFYLETSVANSANVAQFNNLQKDHTTSTAKKTVLFLPQTLDRLRAMFYQGFYNHANWRPNFLEFHAVDYRNNGSGLTNADDYLCHFSVFVKLFEDRQFDAIDELFNTRDTAWDAKLARLILFEGTAEPADPFMNLCREFTQKISQMTNVRSLDMFRNQTWYHNRNHVPICSQLYRDWLKVDYTFAALWSSFVLSKMHSYNIAQRYIALRAQTPMNMDTYVELAEDIDNAHMWYMDSPSMCTMMVTAQRCKSDGLANTVHLGYFGAQHVSNLIPFLHHLDQKFITDQGGTGKVTPIAEIRHGLISALERRPPAPRQIIIDIE